MISMSIPVLTTVITPDISRLINAAITNEYKIVSRVTIRILDKLPEGCDITSFFDCILTDFGKRC